MRVYMHGKNKGIHATAEYNPETKTCTVLKGSCVSTTVTFSGTFRGGASIEKARYGNVENNVVIKDVSFKSASSAANFVTGTSTNGLKVWKDIDGRCLKELIKEKSDE